MFRAIIPILNKNSLLQLPFFLLLFLVHLQPARAQSWRWQPAPRVLNPSGLEIVSHAARVELLDWPAGGRHDVAINDFDGFRLYLQHDGEQFRWQESGLALPAIGFSRDYPSGFQFIDWDGDGDFDLAADGRRFWWNTGTNEEPIWLPDPDLLRDMPVDGNFQFADYDGNGAWDVVAGVYGHNAALHLNAGSNAAPI